MSFAKWLIIITVIIWIFIDIILAIRKNQTISEVVWAEVAKRPWIGFLAGFLCGHLFWGQ